MGGSLFLELHGYAGLEEERREVMGSRLAVLSRTKSYGEESGVQGPRVALSRSKTLRVHSE